METQTFDWLEKLNLSDEDLALNRFTLERHAGQARPDFDEAAFLAEVDAWAAEREAEHATHA